MRKGLLVIAILCGSAGSQTVLNLAASLAQISPTAVSGVFNPAECGALSRPAWCSGADLGAWTNAAIAACSGTCLIYWPPGNYSNNTTIQVTTGTVSIIGAGPMATHLFTKAADTIVIHPSLGVCTIPNGTFSGFTIEGVAPTVNTSAIHLINACETRIIDVEVRGMTGTIGELGSAFWLDDRPGDKNTWSERNTFERVKSFHNRKAFRFTNNGGTGSFARTECRSCFVNVNAHQYAVSVETISGPSAGATDGYFDIRGNLDEDGATMISVDGSSQMGGDFAIEFENDAGADKSTALNLASGSRFLGLGRIYCDDSCAESISPGAHFLLTGYRDPAQQEFQFGIGPWLVPQTNMALEGVGFNIRIDDRGIWSTNGDNVHNGGGFVGGNNGSGEIGVYSVPSSGGAGQSLTWNALRADKVASFTTTKGIQTFFPSMFIAQGTIAMPTAALSGGACSSAITVAAPGVTTSMHIQWNYAGNPIGIPGYGTNPVTIGAWLTNGNVNFIQCASSAVVPGTISLNWTVF
jgi:hypothetical protein